MRARVAWKRRAVQPSPGQAPRDPISPRQFCRPPHHTLRDSGVGPYEGILVSTLRIPSGPRYRRSREGSTAGLQLRVRQKVSSDRFSGMSTKPGAVDATPDDAYTAMWRVVTGDGEWKRAWVRVSCEWSAGESR